MTELDPLPPDFDPSYLSTVDELYHDQWAARKLLRIRWLQRSIEGFWPQGHPARLIHVAGTNGKGTVCRMLEAALHPAGGAGAMTNPHLFDFIERCTIGGRPLPRREWARLWRTVVRPHSLDRGEPDPDRCLSFAEAGILLALHAFTEAGLRWGLVETGVGGRYAPSMAITPVCCVLTNVGRDHPETLGHCVWQRALEKAGIARAGVPLVTAATGEGLAVVRRVAEEEKSPLHLVGPRQEEETRALADSLGVAGTRPPHGWLNLALAATVIRIVAPELDPAAALASMLDVAPLPGRFWQAGPHLLADVAHNPDKLAALAAELELRHPGRPLLLVFGASRNRPLAPMLAPLVHRTACVIFTSASYAGRDPEQLAAECRDAYPALATEVVPDPRKALARAEARRGHRDLVVITGSAYTIDQALNPDPLMKRLNAEYGRRGGELSKS
ncbi:MAG: hypothetical protein Q8O14_10480 [bacterium]|jgi:dihydrofolate synthase/folylpolyglutamate synthase|nr:hypothetical protein [bacterium]